MKSRRFWIGLALAAVVLAVAVGVAVVALEVNVAQLFGFFGGR